MLFYFILFFLVVKFSKKTGDFNSLSAVDLRVLALTYMLEVEANGTEGLRKEPVKVNTINYLIKMTF